MSKKAAVCLNVFPSLEYVEIIKLDHQKGDIERAGALPIRLSSAGEQLREQNEAGGRSEADLSEMAQTIRDLYDLNKIPLNSPTILVLPSFFSREIDIPSTDISKSELRLALVAEAERFYIFKKNEPFVDWIPLADNKLLYSAFPKTQLDDFVQVFQQHRIPLVAIEASYLSIIRGLVSTGAIDGASAEKWALVILSDSGFFSAVSTGIQIEKTFEAPLSVEATNPTEEVLELKKDFDTFVSGEALTKLVFVNNANRLDSQTFLSHLHFPGQIVVVEQNGSTLRSRGAVDGPFPCSLEAIGGAFYHLLPEFPTLNLMPELKEDLIAIDRYRRFLTIGLVALNLVLGICILAAWGVLNGFVSLKESEKQNLQTRLSQLETQVGAFDEKSLKTQLFIKDSVARNVQVNDVAVKLGVLLPDDMWLTRVNVEPQPGALPALEIKGGSLSPDPVNQYQNDLKQAFTFPNLQVSQADLKNLKNGQSYYQWVIRTQDGGASATVTDPNGTGSPQ